MTTNKFSTITIFIVFAFFFAFAVYENKAEINLPDVSSNDSLTEILPNGNLVIVDPLYSEPGKTNIGAVYLYHAATRQLISKLTGNFQNDQIGSGGINVLSNGNFVVRSPYFRDSPTQISIGATTWINGLTGLSGVATAQNSVLGASLVITLSNGNYLVVNEDWNSATMVAAGAVRWCSGEIGAVDYISIQNSLVGTMAIDRVGTNVMALSNGNYLVFSPFWDNKKLINGGAITWGNGTSGTVGAVSSANSLVGGNINDMVDGRIIPLTNGNYAALFPKWDNGNATDVGAVTWGNGNTGIVGFISSANSLVGSTLDDFANSAITPLNNGNYVVINPYWNYGEIVDAGAVTWGNGTIGSTGTISSNISLIGLSVNDRVGYNGITLLTNGNYVIKSLGWDNGNIPDVGAVTWADGASGSSGYISPANSLVGLKTGDLANAGFESVTALTNGNYVVSSPFWDNGEIINVGAATWGNGTTGSNGVISSANSLVGSNAEDKVGSAIALTNGNYVIKSSYWDNGNLANAGAATWCNGVKETVGIVSIENSLVGSTVNAFIGSHSSSRALTNGNYVVGGLKTATFGNGTTGTVGVVSLANSLVDTSPNGYISTVTPLINGNYVVTTPHWSKIGGNLNGAITWGNGTAGTVGIVSPANSLIGRISNSSYSNFSEVKALPNGNFVALSIGSITYGAGNGKTVGEVNERNTLFEINISCSFLTYKFDPNSESLFIRTCGNKMYFIKPIYTAVSDGDWANGATWDYGAFNKPQDVIIPNGRTVNLDGIKKIESLNIGCTGSVAGADSSRYIIGDIKKSFCNTGAFSYPTGTENGFSPVDVNITSLAVNPSTLMVRSRQEFYSDLDETNSLRRFWSLKKTGNLTADLIFNYTGADVFGDESTYKLFRVLGDVPTQITPFTLNTEANTISASGISDFSDWAVGNLAK